MMPAPDASRWERPLALLVLLLAVGAALTFPIAAITRAAYPYELEWLESEILQHVERVVEGKPLYAKPSAEFSPTIYPPVYAWTSSLVARVIGVSLLAPRLVSILSLLATALLVGWLAARISGDRRGGMVAACLLLACYIPCGSFFDLARLDPLWILFLVAATALVVSTRSVGGAVLAGAAFTLATATKQPAVLFAGVAALGLWTRSRKQAVAMAATWLGSSALFYLVLHVATDGWSTIYTALIPLRVPHLPGEMVHFLRDDLLRGFAPSIALLVLWMLTPRNERPGGSLPAAWWLAFGAAVAATTLMRTLQGGGLNTLLPLFAFGALMIGAVSGRALAHGETRTRLAVLVALSIQFGMLIYNPLRLAPTAAERQIADAFVAEIAAIDGDVWVPSHTSYARLAGKRFLVHRDPLLDLLYSNWDAFPEDLIETLENGGFAALYLDGTFAEDRIEEAIAIGYVLDAELENTPTTSTGYRTRPTRRLIPRKPPTD